MTVFPKTYKAYLLLGYAFLLLTHFVLKDYFFPLSVIFYAFPLPILILGGIILYLFFKYNKNIKIGLLLLCCALLFVWIKDYYYQTTNSITEKSSSIIFWNVAKNKNFPIDIIIEKLNQYNPEIIGLVEASYITTENIDILKKRFPIYEFQILEGNMLIGIKGEINNIEHYSAEKSHKFNHITATINEKSLSVLLTDVYASPFIDKQKPLNSIEQYALKNNISFVIGDFNTPYESVHFKNLQENYHSLHHYTNGFTTTWPFGIPLLELDQIFINKKTKPIALKKYNFNASDHQLLIGIFKEL